jgi:hypothetical protein
MLSAGETESSRKAPGTTWPEFRCFVIGGGACGHVVEAARSIWVEFEAERARETLLYRL